MAAFFVKTNTLLDTVVPLYISSCLQTLGDAQVGAAIKGKFTNLKYTPEGYDASELSTEEKLELLGLLFDQDVALKGRKDATTRLETMFVQTRDRLGAQKSFSDLIAGLPQGVFETEKIKHLSREDLEDQLKLYISEVAKLQKSIDDTVNSKSKDLQTKNKVLETILYNAGDGVYTVDQKGMIATFNRTMEDITGYSFDDVAGKPVDDFVKLYDDNALVQSKRYNPVSNSNVGQSVYSNNKLTLEAKDGSKHNVKMVSSTLPAMDGVALGSIVTITDISRESELETMKLDFVSIAAHELRTPLTSIRGYLTLLNSELENKIDKNPLDYLRKITVAADQLYILVENLLNISRIERGNLILQKTTEDWVSLVSGVVEGLQGMAAESKVELSVLPPSTPIPSVSVDKVMISEVVSNLIDNAVKYNKENGHVSIIIEPVNDEIITHVKDTGVGIPEESKSHLFKKFYRTSTSVWRQGKKGTGLGLFISHEIVKLHGGRIWFDSKLNAGSTFSFTVPIATNQDVQKNPRKR